MGAKHKKTLEQKKIADLRHNLYSFNNTNFSTLKFQTVYKAENESNAMAISNYPYLRRDILKTSALTGLIAGAQVIFFLLLKQHILVLPMVKY